MGEKGLKSVINRDVCSDKTSFAWTVSKPCFAYLVIGMNQIWERNYSWN